MQTGSLTRAVMTESGNGGTFQSEMDQDPGLGVPAGTESQLWTVRNVGSLAHTWLVALTEIIIAQSSDLDRFQTNCLALTISNCFLA